jgi:glycerophosphoryl diester phosphodiesterase
MKGRFVPMSLDGGPYIVAHRGISAKAPENTLAAFAMAAQTAGIDMIELDVRLTLDEQVIVFHDRNLQRTTTGNGAARRYTLQEIRQFNAGSWFHPSFAQERVPTLKEVLELVRGRLWVNIEIKSDYFHREPEGLLESKVLQVVRECGMLDQVLVSSFNHELVGRIKQLCPEVYTGVLYNLYRDFPKKTSKIAMRVHASAFICAKHEITRAMVEDARSHKIAVYVYTLDSLQDAEKMRSLGVDGVMSNRADEIVAVLPDRNLEQQK